MSNYLWPHDCSTPGFPVLHHLSELAQTHVYWVSDAIQPSHPPLSPYPPTFKGLTIHLLPVFLNLYSSIQFNCSVMSDSLQPHEPQHSRPPCPSLTPGVYPNSCPLSRWCHPTISSSVVPVSFCLQSFPALGSFPMSPVLQCSKMFLVLEGYALDPW